MPLTEKQIQELWIAERFAEAHNRDHGTDYTARLSDRERDSADAYLESSTHGTLRVQICTVTTEERSRVESVQTRAQRKIREELTRRGFRNCYVTIIPNPDAELTRENERAWIDGAVALVEEYATRPERVVEIDADEIDPSADAWVDRFHGLPFGKLKIYKDFFRPEAGDPVLVNFLILRDVLEVQQTLQAAIDAKREIHYSDQAELVLVLYPGEGFFAVEGADLDGLEFEGVNEFRGAWIVYPQRDRPTELIKLCGPAA